MRLSTFHSFSKFVAFLMQMDILLVLVIAAAKSLQSCPTLCDPIDGSPPGSLSLGFSRQEHWSGLPFPSPMHESEKWKGSCSVVSDFSRPHGLQPTRPLRRWDFPGKSTEVSWHCFLPSDTLQLSESQQNHYIWEVCSANQWDALKTTMPTAGIGQQNGHNTSSRQCLTAEHVTQEHFKSWTDWATTFDSSAIFT